MALTSIGTASFLFYYSIYIRVETAAV